MRPPEALFSTETKRQALERANYSCENCGKTGRLEIHHILPIYIATQVYKDLPHVALSVLENALVLCTNCHNKEHDRDWYLRDYSTQAMILYGMLEIASTSPTPTGRVQNPDTLPERERQQKKSKR